MTLHGRFPPLRLLAGHLCVYRRESNIGRLQAVRTGGVGLTLLWLSTVKSGLHLTSG